MKRKKVLQFLSFPSIGLLVLNLLTGFWLGACTPSPEKKETSLLTVLASPAEILDPSWDMQSKRLIWDAAFAMESSDPLQPELAENWEHSPDELEWRITLRKDASWHDGHPITAHDIEFTVGLWNNPKISHYAFGLVNSLSIHDDYTLSIGFSRPPQSDLTWWNFLPEHLCSSLNPEEFWDWEFWKNPVGSGPYRFVRLLTDSMVELESNPDYYGTHPRIERVRFRTGGDPLVELISDNVDLIQAEPSHVLKVKNDDRFEVHTMIRTNAYLGMVLHHTSELFKDASIRKALLLAINRRELHAVENLPDNLLIFDGPFTGDQFWNNRLINAVKYDPELAGRLLDEAGWKDRNNDGVRERDGQSCSFTVLTAGNSNAGIYIQECMKKVGVKMEISSMEPSVIQARLIQGKFDAILFRLWNRVDGNWSYGQFFGENGVSAYENPDVIALLERLKEHPRKDEEEDIFSRLYQIFQEDVPLWMLAPSVKYFITNRRVYGLTRLLRLDPLGQIPKLWLEKE